MSAQLPSSIKGYFAGKSVNNLDAMLDSFLGYAIVKDEGDEVHGRAAIRKWIEETNRKYRYSVEVRGFTEDSGKTNVACRLTGDFPGSPLDVNYRFVLHDGKIRQPEIS